MGSDNKQGTWVSNPQGLDKQFPQGFRPSDFMRARRPERFSDSTVNQEPKLPPSVFEHHLASLTSRKQEADFEYFCRRLAEKFLCPHLLPQTGPTGGGDSKVDSETYPVADEVSLRWYEGVATRAESEEPWAFAFSAKKAWRPKVHSDVAKIARTGRGYKLIYFITNQCVRDKDRAEVESSLKKRYRVAVRILDATWIRTRVFEHGCVRLAIETLHLTGYEADQKVKGPRDAERELELKQLEEEIRDPERYKGVWYQLAEGCLHAALLARGLELPRVEIEGRFSRAEQIASRVGHRQQQLRIAYARAWTVFWWFDDFAELARLYEQVEHFAVGTGQVDDLELLLNIWRLLAVSVSTHGLDAGSARLDARTATLRAELQRLASDTRRPNNALGARTDLLLMELQEGMADPKVVSRVLRELKLVVAEAEGLISYPTEILAKLVEEMGEALGTNPEYDPLFEALADVMRRRVSDGEAGRMLLARGHQKLRKDHPYDAIRLYGRAQQLLAKREYRLELIAALVGGCLAYESAGLLWAARANALAAANQAFSEYYEEGQILPQALTCLRKLAWLELQLGRVAAVLQWIETASLVAQHLGLTEKRRKAYWDERTMQDAVLGILLLKADIPALRSLSFLPAVLEHLGLDLSYMAVLYALGYEDHLRKEGLIPATETPESVREFHAKWVEQPATKDLPEKPEFGSGDTVVLRSSVLGCEVTARAENNFDSVCLAEQILGALEALLATSLERVLPYAQQFAIEIAPSDTVEHDPERELHPTANLLAVRHARSKVQSPWSSTGGRWLQDLVIEIALRIGLPNNPEDYAKQVFGQEAAFDRAINFSDPSTPLKNIVGDKPKLRISDWEPESPGNAFPLVRAAPWCDGVAIEPKSRETSRMYESLGDGEPPKELFDFTTVKHTECRVFSLIDVRLWDKAGWQGMAYAFGADLSEPPILALAFTNPEAAREIFTGWRSRLGKVDENEELHVSLITGIDRKNPFSYAVVVGSNPQVSTSRQLHHLVMVSRIHRMHPQDSSNLDQFLRRFERIGRYLLVPAHLASGAQPFKMLFDLWVGKCAIRVLPAWQLGRNDPDAIALQPGDDPIIPEGVEDAPVLALLKKLRERSSSAGR